MRLLNVRSGRIEEFSGAQIPPYSVVSHTWGEDEVTFSDIQLQQASILPIRLSSFGALSQPETKASYVKIRYAREQARRDGYDYVWVDTCCIDKSSSAELSEAINSMFRYYHKAGICYAYLEDVQGLDIETEFVSSRWFTRGWTLQELLAPNEVIFFGKNWQKLGTREDLAVLISPATGIDAETLVDPSRLRDHSVARRMSWASRRTTTRVEDMAYCLLGIFGVNMPLLYGEGENAFIRLQEEIMKYSDDQSLFAWSVSPDFSKASQTYGMFAQSPQLFANSGKIIPIQIQRHTSPYTMTNRGLQIDLPLLPSNPEELPEAESRQFLGLIDCQFEDDFSTCLAITLQQTHASRVLVRLEGAGCSIQKVTPERAAQAVMQTLYIPREFKFRNRSYLNCLVRSLSLREHGYELVKAFRPDHHKRSRWNPETQTMRIEGLEESGSMNFLPFATFVFHNRIQGLGFAVRLNMQEEEEMPVRVSRLQEKPNTLSFGQWYDSLACDVETIPHKSSVTLSRHEEDGSLLDIEVTAQEEYKNVFDQKLHTLTIGMKSFRRFEVAGAPIFDLPTR